LKKLNPQARESDNSEIKKIGGLLSKQGVRLSTGNSLASLTSRGYGTPEKNKLTLNVFETLFLQSKGILEVKKGKRPRALDFQQLLHQFELVDKNVWAKYLVYRDMRSRGYVVREGFGLGIDFRVYERGEYGKATATYLILEIQEGKPISANRFQWKSLPVF